MKNLNSFRYLAHALEYRNRAANRRAGIGRHGHAGDAAVERGGRADGADAVERICARLSLFPRSGLVAGERGRSLIADVQREMPELPAAKRARFVQDYGIAPYDAGVLTASRALADYFEAAVGAGAAAKTAAGWISVELLRRLNDAGRDISDCPVMPAALAELLKKVEGGEITAASGKKVFEKMFETGKSAGEIIAAEGLAQISGFRRDREDCARGGGEESGQRGEISQRQRRRVQVFRRTGDARDARAGESATRE